VDHWFGREAHDGIGFPVIVRDYRRSEAGIERRRAEREALFVGPPACDGEKFFCVTRVQSSGAAGQ
jgi:hypothetical protein